MTSAAVRKSLRAVAIIEALKGILVLGVGFGLLSFLHRDGRAIAYKLISRLHLDPLHKFPKIFIELASGFTDSRLWFFASIAALYSAFRFAEAYGLWHDKSWAEWLAVLCGSVYIPLEVYEILQKPSWLRILILLINCAVVLLMSVVLYQKRKSLVRSEPT